MDAALLRSINAARRARQAIVLVSDLSGGRDNLYVEGEAETGPLGEAVTKALLTGKASSLTVDGRDYLINPHVPAPRMVIIGAVHISQALAPMAAMAGFAVTIVDPRTAFATGERFTGADLRSQWPEDVLRDEPLDRHTALVAVTHDPKIDDFPLIAALKAGSLYVGALGSRKTHGRRVERLLAAGVSATDINRIAAPIGLAIGAASPAEIAVAILAQAIAAFRLRGATA